MRGFQVFGGLDPNSYSCGQRVSGRYTAQVALSVEPLVLKALHRTHVLGQGADDRDRPRIDEVLIAPADLIASRARMEMISAYRFITTGLHGIG